MKLKYIIISIIIMIIGFIISNIHVIFPNIPIFITMLSIFPIYMITRKIPSLGLMSYIGTFMMILLFDYNSALIFIFINGLLGIFIGLFNFYTTDKYIISILSGGVLTLGINIIGYVGEKNILNIFNLNETSFIQVEIYIFSVIGCAIILVACNYIYNKIINIKLISNIIE